MVLANFLYAVVFLWPVDTLTNAAANFAFAFLPALTKQSAHW